MLPSLIKTKSAVINQSLPGRVDITNKRLRSLLINFFTLQSIVMLRNLIFLALAFPMAINLNAQEKQRDICYFYLYDVSKSAAKTVPQPDTAELGKLLRAHGKNQPIFFAGLYIQTNSEYQQLEIGPTHYLDQQLIEGNWVNKGKIRAENERKQREFEAKIQSDLQGCLRFFSRPSDQQQTDITSALLFFERFAKQPSNQNVEFHLVLFSDMKQDRIDQLSLTPFALPKNVTVWIVGAPVKMRYSGIFPGVRVHELVDFKAQFFLKK